MGYTKDVDKGSRNPEPTAYRSFISLLPPFLFCEMTGSAPAPFPHGPGRFPARWGRGEFVKNLSKSVQESFTNSAGCWGILWLSEGKTPSLRQTPFNTLFSFFHLFFLPSFSFCIGMRPASLPLRKQGVSLCTGQFFQQKQIFHRPFKICSYMGRGNGVY